MASRFDIATNKPVSSPKQKREQPIRSVNSAPVKETSLYIANECGIRFPIPNANIQVSMVQNNDRSHSAVLDFSVMLSMEDTQKLMNMYRGYTPYDALYLYGNVIE